MTLVAFIVLGFGALGRITWFRLTLYLLAVLFCTSGLVAAMGTPRPRWTFLHMPEDSTLVAMQMVEPAAIYAWIIPDGSSIPVAVEFPWGEALADQMQQAMQGAKATHGHARMRAAHGRPEAYVSTIVPMSPKANKQ